MSVSSRTVFLMLAAFSTGACSDPAPPEPEVASIELSVPDTGTSILFREPLIVTATPLAALGVPLDREVTWQSVSPAVLSVQRLDANGASARVSAVSIGTGDVRVSAGGITRSFRVTIEDTVHAVRLTPRAINLIAGDTISFLAAVEGPATASRSVRWDTIDSSMLRPVVRDSTRLLVQVRRAGATTVRARAVADTTKADSSSLSAQLGTLVFGTQPTATYPSIRITPAPRVHVLDAGGIVSRRAINDITLVPGGACGASVTGVALGHAVQGVAEFPRVGVSARCPSVVLMATASPPAQSATSDPFAVTARGCDVAVPMDWADTVQAALETADCVVMHNGQPYYTHTYHVSVRDTATTFRIFTQGSGFSPRLEAYLWPHEPTLAGGDSLYAEGESLGAYALLPGTYRFVLTSSAAAATGTYVLLSGARAGEPRGTCVWLTTAGVSVRFFVIGCPRDGTSLPATVTNGRKFRFYLGAGKSATISLQQVESGLLDPYLEVVDVTQAPSRVVLGSDNNSGGGPDVLDARVVVPAAASGRLIEVLAGTLRGGGNNSGSVRLTISP